MSITAVSNDILIQDFADLAQTLQNPVDLAGKTILISGIAGFIPAYLTEALIYLDKAYKLKLKIIGLARNLEAAQQRFSKYQDFQNLSLLRYDLQHDVALPGRADIVIHAASQASPKYYGSDPVGTALPNIVGTLSLLRYAQQTKGAQFLFMSTGEIYGQQDAASTVIHENDMGKIDPMDVRSCYAESKRMGENLCVSFMHQYSVPIKIARIFHTYGPGMKLDDGRVFADFVRNVVLRQPIIMRSNGNAIRPFCYVADTVRALIVLLTRGVPGQAYNIANPHERVSILELAKILQSAYPERNIEIQQAPIEERGYIASQISDLNPDISKLGSLGWVPKIGIEEGFKRTIRSYE
jgi:nucleoside-diphosphate-sugar epimerase